MSQSTCPNDVGSPSTWLASSGLSPTRKACAIPLGVSCGNNLNIIGSCCKSASDSQSNSSHAIQSFSSGEISVCALPEDATTATFQIYQDCILNYPGRDGGFRCNDVEASNRADATCNNSLTTTITTDVIDPPRSVQMELGSDRQSCVTAAVANSSAVMERCCGSPAVSFEGGCWQYCVGPARDGTAQCIADGLREWNLSTGTGAVACFNGSSGDSTSDGVRVLDNTSIASTMGLVVVVAFMVGLI